jgi:hypothetical protein
MFTFWGDASLDNIPRHGVSLGLDGEVEVDIMPEDGLRCL